MPKIKCTMEFSKEQILEALIVHFNLPCETVAQFKLRSDWENDRMGGGSTKTFDKAIVSFLKPLKDMRR